MVRYDIACNCIPIKGIAFRSRLLGDDSFGHPGQMLKWTDLRVSPVLYKLFDQCDI